MANDCRVNRFLDCRNPGALQRNRVVWNNFLRSLETDGGKLVVLVFLLLVLAGTSVLLLVTGHTPQEAGRSLLISAISSLLGILYGYLKSNGGTKQ